jgi:hypothetical protein
MDVLNIGILTSGRQLLAVGAVALGMTAAVPAAAKELRLQQVDQASQDPEFMAWRTALLDAVRRRDVDYVVAQADPNIKLSFGDDYGADRFREFLTGDGASRGETYWSELQTVLELGGVFMDDNTAFCTPYLSCLDIPGCLDCDPYETVYVMGDKVAARAQPDPNAAVLATLSWNVLRLDYEAESPAGWHPVKLPDGRTAYLTDRESRMSIDYRARIEKTGAGWRMTVFIAGD